MTNSDLFSLYKLLLRKNGISEPQDAERFELLLQQENMSYFKELATSYSKDQDIADSLSPFEVQVQVSTLTTTTTNISLPTGYAHFIGMYHTDDDGYVRAFDLVTDDEWDMHMRSSISFPTDKYPICKIVASYIYMFPTFNTTIYDDWFLPNLEELRAVSTNLFAYGVGNLNASNRYWSSSEITSLSAWGMYVIMTGAGYGTATKDNTYRVRPCRKFTDVAGAYSLRDEGPAGGWIFYISGTTYYEAYTSDISDGYVWSNITARLYNTLESIGYGQANTTLIINQAGHTTSAAKLCDDLIVTVYE